MKPYGISEDSVTAILDRPEQSQIIALEGESNQSVAMFAGRAQDEPSASVILVAGKNAGEQLQVSMAFRVPPRLTGPPDAMEPPLKMLEGLANLCGLPVVVGQRIANFITSERIPIAAGSSIPAPAVQNVANSPFLIGWLVRSFMEGGQAYADCALLGNE